MEPNYQNILNFYLVPENDRPIVSGAREGVVVMLSCSGLVSEERGSRYCSVTQETEVTRSGPGDKLLEASEDGGQTVILRGG